jgi:hypothetical protein
LKSSKDSDAFLALVCLGIGHSVLELPNTINWKSVQALAVEHDLYAVVLDGIERLPESLRPPQELLLEWIGETLQGYEYRYEQYRRVIAELAGFYNSHGFKLMILKGYACSLDWPKPAHRPCGDIDIWQFGKQKEADAALIKEKGIAIDNTHHHHTVFNWGDFSVENHYDFLNIYHHRSNVELEAILKELGDDDGNYVELNGEKIYMPSANLHALFLLRHAMSNFASTGLLLRQLLDWGFFVEAHGKEVDWKWLESMLEKHGMKTLYMIFNAICVEDLGFAPKLFHQIQFVPSLKERVLNDIIAPEFSEIEKGGFIRRAIYKYRRWKANEWKHELCFNESMWSAFCSGVWNHLLKPSSI